MTTLGQLAERIVTGTTLDDKLVTPPRGLVDAADGPGRWPRHPGRPPELALHRGPRPPLPHPRNLRTDEQRAIVLHAMANHELLAVELFALAILRFVDAPRALRRSWLATLIDEQRHVRAYVDRLANLGVSFGTWPVSAFFWDALKDVDTPLAFVSGLELGLEQANLDFARIWAAAFARAGDTATARVLDEVHADEIRHVRVGAHWLRQLKDPALDDFTAWTGALRFPLTPARGRGPTFDRAARHAAGLDASFIERMAVTSNSRGRSPRVFVFDAGLEDQWVPRTSPAWVARLTNDLAPILAILASEDDVVVARRPTEATLRRWQGRGLPVPQFVASLDPDEWPGRGVPVPWGWSPTQAQRLGPLFGEPPTMERWRLLHHKSWAADQLRAFAERFPDRVAAGDLGVVADTRSAIDAARTALGPCEVFAKAACSTSGRHRVRLAPGPLPRAAVRALDRFLREGPVVVERVLPVAAELSTHLMIDDPPKVLGTTRFGAEAGAFRGLVVGAPTLGLAPPWRRACHEHRLEDQARTAAEWVGRAAAALGYRGPLSVDALIVDDPKSGPRLKPISEVNARYTMGHLGHRLRRRLAGDVGVWAFVPVRTLERAGFATPEEFVASLPATVVPTNEPTHTETVQTLLWASPRYDDVVADLTAWIDARGPSAAPLRRALGFVSSDL